MVRRLGVIGLSLFVLSCAKDPEVVISDPDAEMKATLLEVPSGFPTIPFPEENQFSLEKWKLGKRLFFDPLLSRDRSVSCASCHKPSLAFSDDLAVSPGVEGRIGDRNSPSLANVAYLPYFTREGGVPTLEMQVLVPIQEHTEFDFDILQIADRLLNDSSYVQMSQSAFDRIPDAYVITRALATFERTLISGNSAFDLHQSGEQFLDNSSKRGMDLFFSDRTSCSGCHGGFNFSEYAFENNGLYEDYADAGKYRLTHDSADLSLFKVPSLRNVGLTAPYMHDGSLGTLRAVVEHYNSGGFGHINKSDLIRPLNLSETEIGDLVQFLEALTDPTFISNKDFHESE
ncbi:MAG: cytochrome c peroxidase [Cryomorphaceae bacterium]